MAVATPARKSLNAAHRVFVEENRAGKDVTVLGLKPTQNYEELSSLPLGNPPI
jgi:hypothetical protein